ECSRARREDRIKISDHRLQTRAARLRRNFFPERTARIRLACRTLRRPTRIRQHDADVQALHRLARYRKMFRVAEEQGTATVFEKLAYLISVKRGIERHRCASGRDSTEICSHPARMVVGQDGKPRAALELFF